GQAAPANADLAGLGLNDPLGNQLADLANGIAQLPRLLADAQRLAAENARQDDPGQIADRLARDNNNDTPIPPTTPFQMPPFTQTPTEKEPSEKSFPEATPPV